MAGPGYRHTNTGVLTSVGANGYSWSSTVEGINGRNLNFNSQGLNPSNTNNRGYGFQVRCLQAFTRPSGPFFLYTKQRSLSEQGETSGVRRRYGVGVA